MKDTSLIRDVFMSLQSTRSVWLLLLFALRYCTLGNAFLLQRQFILYMRLIWQPP